MSLDLDLKGHRFAVTGAASGIGRATTIKLVQSGAEVIALDLQPPKDAVGEFIRIDLADPNSITAAVAGLPPDLSGLLNVAGVPGTVAPDVLARVNYLGLRMLTEAVIPNIRSGGAIVNVASTAGENWRDNVGAHLELAATASFADGLDWVAVHPWPRERAYAWFKEALIVWTTAKSAAIRAKHGIRINCVSPGPVDTPILEQFRISLGEERVSDALRRGGGAARPEDIADPIIFLASAAARWIVGSNLVIDGGASASRLDEISLTA
ncbi:coniferyl-alcohol dehydrogenase [Bradyrhizobium sp. 1(2017)]|uniref:coniferyl-alcohol dehydrogenase n=1 Tax=Bradyrhizobium sp. 1(2017) TaxID=1404888 RepID=UPI00140E9B78|nr:coniferyl-alcohol dehydrogenase [Bradyrhizobium sp. 1(2017)]QIO36920.1 SDR family oxidoreductase [Bradyrhizobium sp. 1(2017)]